MPAAPSAHRRAFALIAATLLSTGAAAGQQAAPGGLERWEDIRVPSLHAEPMHATLEPFGGRHAPKTGPEACPCLSGPTGFTMCC
jgi:hypothetical protein